MALQQLKVQKYRSLRQIELDLQGLNVVVGPNGSGKSNLYQALWLIARVCEGDFARSLCREGGLLSAMWAGPRTNAKRPQRMTLSFRTEDMTFEIACGYPVPGPTRFLFDPEIKEEVVWFGPKRLPSRTLLQRKGGLTRIRDEQGAFIEYPLILDPNESVLAQLREPHRFPELFNLREEVRSWRFYHSFRTDAESPMRMPQVSVRTPVLSHDGSDLAAALQTIMELGDGQTLDEIISTALPGRSLCILSNDSQPWGLSPAFTELAVALETQGCVRPLLARELSDGTLKFLCLAASLLSPRPPTLIPLNEPESSLHPELLPSLAKLIVNASQSSQVWVSTHSLQLVDYIQQLSGIEPIRLKLEQGETKLDRSES